MSAFVSFLALGISAGLAYALLALGMVLIYKGTRILNFAHPFFGLLTAFLCWWITWRASFPPFSWLPFQLGTRPRFVMAAVISLVLIGLNGWSLEHNIIRRLRRAPRLVLFVLTIALAQGTVGFVSLLFLRTEEQATTFRAFPQLLRVSLTVGRVHFNGDQLLAMAVTLIIGVIAAIFFTRAKFGVAIRAAAENPDAARLLGISADKVSSFVWIVGSVLAGIAGILITQVVGILNVGTLSTGFLVRGLTAALIGGLTSLPGAVAGGLIVGVTEWMLRWQLHSRPGPPETALFLFVIAILVFKPGGLFGRPEQTESNAAFVPTIRELPARLRNSLAARGVRVVGLVPVALLALASFTSGSSTNGVFVVTLVYAMVGVSLTLLMGYTGQISLGHWGLAGVGAFGLANLVTRMNIPYFIALPLVVAIGMIVSLAIGLPALRIRGLYLAITTLSFNLAVEIFVFNIPLIGGTSAGIHLKPPKVGPFDLADPSYRPLFLFTLALLGLSMLVARNIARSRTGRGFFALRENEKAAATFGVDLTRYKLLSFAVSGGIAALAGALFVTYLQFAEATTWSTGQSFLLVAMVMIGGIGSLSGSLMGAFLVIGLPRLLHFSNPWIVPIATGALLLIVIVRARGGLAGLIQLLRERVVAGLDELARPATVPREPTPETPAR